MKSLLFAVLVTLFAAFAWSATMTGGFKDVDFNGAGVKNAIEFAVNLHNKGRNDMYRSQAVEVLKAQSQVVAGVKYVITVKMGRTNCRKDNEDENCGLTAENYECTFTVWSKPWANFLSVLDEKCS